MAHQVEQMAYSGKTPWHGLGTTLTESDRLNWQLVCEKAGLDYEVETVPVYTRESVTVNGQVEEYSEEIENQFLLRRTTDKEPYAIVTKNYHPLQNRHALEWFNPWIEAGMAKFETAGSLKSGAVIWALAEIDGLQADVVPGDKINRYVLLSNSHNKMHAANAGFTDIRVVCNNTLSQATSDINSKKLVRVKHTRGINENMVALRSTMDIMRQEFKASTEQFRKLAHHGFYRDDVVRLVKKIILDVEPEEKMSTRSENILEHILDCVKNSPGSNITPNTAWTAYNGINYYLLQESGTKSDKSNRLYSAWFGVNKAKDSNVLKELLTMAS